MRAYVRFIDYKTATAKEKELFLKGNCSLLPYSQRYRTKNAAVAYTSKGEVIGVWRYSRDRTTIRSMETFVRPKFRKRGVALKLWRTVLQRERPSRVKVTVASNKGYSLVVSAQKRFKEIEFQVIQDDFYRKISYRGRK